MFFLCIFLPPIAALISGGLMSFLLNFLLTCLGWIPGMIHAFMVVNNNKAEQRNQEQIAAIKEQTEALKSKDEKSEEG
ncbi:MAG: YqaE/Pmp3 family membrane protein [Bdellovibrionota bacterium]|nr:YqaE/Pmp3 family membrane protein [Bdellovibrionota bacterium]